MPKWTKLSTSSKREAKVQKALKKREKKEAKRAVKVQKKGGKKEKKARKLAEKAGLEYGIESAPTEEATMGIEWSRRSTVSMEKVERKLDNLFEARGEEIRARWKEKYGDEPDIPSDYFRPKVDIGALDRTPTVSTPTEEGAYQPPAEAAPEKGRLGGFGRKKGKAAEPVAEGPLPLMALKKPTEGLWLYQKYGVGKNKIMGIIMLVISLILWFPMLIVRGIYLLIMVLVSKLKRKNGATAEG